MSKVKEIEVWVDPKEDEFASRVVYVSQFQPRYVKARLIIELPEKKITITEKEFWDAYDNSHTSGPNSHSEVFEKMKQKLFGGEA